jgi:hypothetical protein
MLVRTRNANNSNEAPKTDNIAGAKLKEMSALTRDA